jgi:glycerol-3-phosphate acyltransferase PlsY
MIESVFAILLGYFLGSFPSAYIAARLKKGRDIRQVGGGNMGTLNTLREVGLVAGILVFLADVLKGTLTVLLARWLGVHPVVVFIAGVASIVGHSYPAYISFKGGRGGATAFGVLAGLAPIPAVISFGVMLLVVLVTSNMRLSLALGFVALALLIWAFGGDMATIIYAVVLPLILGVRMILADWGKLSQPGTRENLIIDRNFTPWQSRRRKKGADTAQGKNKE